MKIPHPGLLSHKIDIGHTVSVTNENGFPTETDVTLYTVWASVEDGSSRWFRNADADNEQRVLTFNIRWILGIRPGMWVRFQGEKRTITEVGEYDFRRRYLKLDTQETKGVN